MALRERKNSSDPSTLPDALSKLSISRSRSRSQGQKGGLIERIKRSFGLSRGESVGEAADVHSRDVFNPIGTSTPHHSPRVPNDDVFTEFSIIQPHRVDFAALGAFDANMEMGVQNDLLNDVLHYNFVSQACAPSQLQESWNKLGGEKYYSKTMTYLFELSHYRPIPTECAHLAVHFLHWAVTSYSLEVKDLEPLVVACLHVASKVERQVGVSSRLIASSSKKDINGFEIKILQAVDFRVFPTVVIHFMRMLLYRAGGNCPNFWNLAKFLAELAQCNVRLASLTPPLLAGVVMRLTCSLAGGNWDASCYAIIQEHSELYPFPQSLLCRLLLAAESCPRIYTVFNLHKPVSSEAVENNREWIVQAAQDTSHVYVPGV